jgi:hypothetical protein
LALALHARRKFAGASQRKDILGQNCGLQFRELVSIRDSRAAQLQLLTSF